MWIALVFIGPVIVCLILDAIKENSEKTTVKCKYCGHEFRYSESEVVDYKLNGKLQKAQECPRCGKYTEIQ